MFHLDREHLRTCLLYEFRLGEKAADAHRRLCQACGEGVISEKTCFNRFARFKSPNYSVEDEPRSGRPSELDDALLQLVEADPRMTTRDLAAALGCSHSTIGTPPVHNREGLEAWELDTWVIKKVKELEKRLDSMSKKLATEKGLKTKDEAKRKVLEKELEKEKSVREEIERMKQKMETELDETKAQVGEMERKLQEQQNQDKESRIKEQLPVTEASIIADIKDRSQESEPGDESDGEQEATYNALPPSLSDANYALAIENFDPEEFVERHEWRFTEGDRVNFNAKDLHNGFLKTIQDLQALQTQIERKCGTLESSLRETEQAHWERIVNLEAKHRAAVQAYKALEVRITAVAHQVVRLGDQLEGVHIPRARVLEAKNLMVHFARFHRDGTLPSDLFDDPEQVRLLFKVTQDRIVSEYDKMEKHLLEEFGAAYRSDDSGRMRQLAMILRPFKGYSQCVHGFLENCQAGAFPRGDIFHQIPTLYKRTVALVNDVFANPEQVNQKLLYSLYTGKLQDEIQYVLGDRSDPGKYLENLSKLYSKTNTMSKEICDAHPLVDRNIIKRVVKNIFQKQLENYRKVEARYLKDVCGDILAKYYTSLHHVKKPTQGKGIGEFITQITQSGQGEGDETFLSELIALNILEETKNALKRCQLLSKETELAGNAAHIYEILVHCLLTEHVAYALDLALAAIPGPEPKSPPAGNFFEVIRQINTIVSYHEKLFVENLVPLLASSPEYADCLHRKRVILNECEKKIHTGINKYLNAICGWVKHILQSEQKKTDFKPEGEAIATSSKACTKVVRYLEEVSGRIRRTLDGKNIETALQELGVRFHRVVYDHLLTFQYSSIGAMCVICDVNEYSRCAQGFQVPLVNKLFELLHALCNLLIVPPENLQQVCAGEQLAALDRSTLMSFIQLRIDAKTLKTHI
ncbi:unnamed protein product [Darwinula stevensoni]|uniref:Exocyst complex component 5 n=1 Tax=Darwinula stevensoni TaxID=69355 RepID=A0A7R9A7E6_9CRUS|nr:unnamed protein product [Darwinula stevensoni]CAG0891464.1 unnamed protein product [Darwinula stevensoni]